MKSLKLFLLLFTASLALSTGAYGQDGPPPDDGPHDDRPDARRPNLLAELGLSREQVQQIRRMNQERRPAMMQALGVTPEVIDRCQNHVLAGSKVRRHYMHHDYADEKRAAWGLLGQRIERILTEGEVITLQRAA